MNLKKHFLNIVWMMGVFAGIIHASPLMIMAEPAIEPSPLDTLENNGEGNITFLIGELNDEDVAGDNRFRVSVQMGKVDLKNTDTSIVTITDARDAYADVASKFDVTYLSDYKMVIVQQKADAILPGNMRYLITVPVVVTENTPVTNPNNGFLVNMSSEGDAVADGDVSDYTYTKDQTAPISPEVLIIDGTDVNETEPTTVQTTNHTPSINGICEVGYNVTVQIDDTDIEPTVRCRPEGTFSIVPTNPIEDGNHTVTAIQTDPATGVTSEPSSIDNLIIADSFPTAPTIKTVAGQTGSPVTTADTAPEINGTCEGNATVTIQIDGTNITPTATCINGLYSIIPTTVLTVGEHNVTAITTNDAGNIATSNVVALSVVGLPDFSPQLKTYGNIMYGSGAHEFSFDINVYELAGGVHDENNPVQLRISKNSQMTLTYDETLTIFQGGDVDNTSWTFDDSDPLDYIFTYNGSTFDPNTSSKFGVSGVLTIGVGEVGKVPLIATIRNGSGGDTNVDNNNDSDTLEKRL